jgi:hypothetical protein
MRKMKKALLGSLLFCAATAVWAAAPAPAAAPVPSETVATAPAATSAPALPPICSPRPRSRRRSSPARPSRSCNATSASTSEPT